MYVTIKKAFDKYNNKLLLFNEEEKEKILRTNKNVIIDNNNENLKKYVLEALNDKKSNKYIYLGVIPKETIVRIKSEVTDIKQNKINLVLDEDKRYDLVISQEEIRHLKKESLEESDIVDFVHNISNIIINFDNVRYNKYNKSQNALRFKKRIHNGTYIALEIISNQKGTFRTQTLFLEKVDFIAKKRSISPTLNV